jgi:hypothetical protein
MATVAMVYNPVPADPARWARPGGPPPHFQARYVAGLSGAAGLAGPLRRQAARVGRDHADRWIALSDGGSGLEARLRANFGRLDAVILDFYHAAEYLGSLARALYPGDDAAREAWLADGCHRLKHEGGAAALEGLRGLTVRGREAQEAKAEVVRYFTNQAHRMDYPSYLARGWAIGSGPVEAACKSVIGQRLKGSGMRWGPDGAEALCHLRAMFKSGDRQWDAYWRAAAA